MTAANLWSKLPVELIHNIIWQTDDLKTLESWCAATRNNAHLHHAYLRSRWADITIGEDDLLAIPRGERSHNTAHISAAKTGLINAAISLQKEGIARLPASYIRRLELKLRWRDIPESYFDYDSESDDYEFLPRFVELSFEDFDYSMTALFTSLRNVTTIEIDGMLFSDTLDQIINLCHTSLRALKLRSGTPPSPYPRRDRYDMTWVLKTWHDFPFRFEQLYRLKSLSTLEICHLLPDEGFRLANLLIELPKLKRLLLDAADASPYKAASAPSSLNRFLGCVFPEHSVQDFQLNSPSIKFPATLKSLVLIDTKNKNVLVNEPRLVRRPAYSCLTDLFLNIDNPPAVINLLGWLQGSSISRLAIPGAVRLDLTTPSLDMAMRDLTDHITLVISQYRHTLQQLTLLDIWHSHPSLIQKLNENWESFFFAQELVLGTEVPSMHNINLQEYRSLRNRLYGHRAISDTPRWGSRLERLQINQIEFSKLSRLAEFADSSLAHLKILKLHPWPRRGLVSTSDSARCFSGQQCIEDQIASEIIAEDFPNLQVLVVGDHWFWIERGSAIVHSASSLPPLASTIKLWGFAEAVADATQHTLMLDSLSVEDWNFLNDLSPFLGQQGLSYQTMFWGGLGIRMQKHCNFMTFVCERGRANGVSNRTWLKPDRCISGAHWQNY